MTGRPLKMFSHAMQSPAKNNLTFTNARSPEERCSTTRGTVHARLNLKVQFYRHS